MSKNKEDNIPQGEYDYFFSLGEGCPTAMILKSKGLRSFSGPFDWIGGLDFEDRLNFLLSDNQLILDSDEWEYQGSRFEPEPRDIYVNKRLNMLYPHDFPYSVPLEQSKLVVKNRYERRLRRIRNIMSSEKTILFVYMVATKDKNFDFNRITSACARFNSSIKAKAHVIYIQHDDSIQKGEYEISCPNENLTYLKCAYVENGEKVDNELLKKIFSGYHCTCEKRNRKWIARQKIKKKILSWFINKRIKGNDFYYRILGIKYHPKRSKIK